MLCGRVKWGALGSPAACARIPAVVAAACFDGRAGVRDEPAQQGARRRQARSHDVIPITQEGSSRSEDTAGDTLPSTLRPGLAASRGYYTVLCVSATLQSPSWCSLEALVVPSGPPSLPPRSRLDCVCHSPMERVRAGPRGVQGAPTGAAPRMRSGGLSSRLPGSGDAH